MLEYIRIIFEVYNLSLNNPTPIILQVLRFNYIEFHGEYLCPWAIHFLLYYSVLMFTIVQLIVQFFSYFCLFEDVFVFK